MIAALGGWILISAQNAVDKSMNGQGGSAIDILMPKPLNNEGTGRVNVLITGNSFDDEGHQGAALTDSITVASMDLVNKKITLISIPRDMWVDIPGRGKAKATPGRGSPSPRSSDLVCGDARSPPSLRRYGPSWRRRQREPRQQTSS